MKTPLLPLVCLLAAVVSPAQTTTTGYPSDQAITIPTFTYDIRFSIAWFADDYPQGSAPGRIELIRTGVVVGRVTAGHHRDAGPSVSVMNGTVDNVSSTVAIFAQDGAAADGFLYGTWHLTGLAPGDYTVRAWTYHTRSRLNATTVVTDTSFDNGYSPPPANRAPTIAWLSAPESAGSGESYQVSARGRDDDGDLAQVNVWKNGQPFAFAGGGTGASGDSGNTTTDNGPQTVTFTAQAVDASGATSPVITHTVSIGAPVNAAPTVTLVAPGAQTVTAGTTLTVTGRATDPDGNITAHNLDIRRPAGDWNFQGAFATGSPFQGGPVGSGGDSTRSASFTFTDVGTYFIRSAANDGSGWYQSATVSVTVVSPPPVQYALSTSAGTGGSVTSGGLFNAGTSAAVSAVPDATHDFVGWTGDAAGAANPVAVLMDRNKAVQAVFALKSYVLVTSATTGGAVTPGGAYPPGTTITLSASPDATHRFVGWAGDASGTTTTVAITLNAPKTVQAVFTDKTAQTLTFPTPADQPVAGPPLTLNATVSSGLPVTYVVLSGPATLTGNQLTITGPGAVTVQASQEGDGFYLPAASVTRTFNAYAAALLRYRPSGRTLLQGRVATGAAPYVVETP